MYVFDHLFECKIHLKIMSQILNTSTCPVDHNLLNMGLSVQTCVGVTLPVEAYESIILSYFPICCIELPHG